MAPCMHASLTQKRFGIYLIPVAAYFKVKVGACRSPCAPHGSQNLGRLDGIACVHEQRAHMGVPGFKSILVLHNHGIAVPILITGKHHAAGSGRVNPCALRCGNVHTVMKLHLMRNRIPTNTETGRKWRLHGHAEIRDLVSSRIRASAEGSVALLMASSTDPSCAAGA